MQFCRNQLEISILYGSSAQINQSGHVVLHTPIDPLFVDHLFCNEYAEQKVKPVKRSYLIYII